MSILEYNHYIFTSTTTIAILHQKFEKVITTNQNVPKNIDKH